MKEACGIVGVYAREEDVARSVFFGLYALQHRGQESAGIAATDGHRIRLHTEMGLVSQAFQENDLIHLEVLEGQNIFHDLHTYCNLMVFLDLFYFLIHLDLQLKHLLAANKD